mgnify:CR=1 FL=1
MVHENLNGRVAVITGGGGVLCSGFAKDLAAQGVKVAILDLREEAAQKVADEIKAAGGEALAVGCNVLESESLEAAREKINAALGSCDILVNGAGGNSPLGTTTKDTLELEDIAHKAEGVKTFFDLDPKGIEFVFNLNFLGTLLTTQCFAHENPRIFCGEGGCLELHPVHGGSFCRCRHQSQRDSSRLLLDEPEQDSALQRGRLAYRALEQDNHPHSPASLRRARGSDGCSAVPLRREPVRLHNRRYSPRRRRLLRLFGSVKSISNRIPDLQNPQIKERCPLKYMGSVVLCCGV